MTVGRRELLEDEHLPAAASAGAAGPSEGLRAGRSSGRTKPEYPAGGGRRDHATFGSGPMRQSDERDSELLRHDLAMPRPELDIDFNPAQARLMTRMGSG